jgi:hypothetical protein
MEPVAAARTPGADHDIAPPEHGEELFEVGEGDFLAFGHFGEGDRPNSRILRHINQSYDRITTLGPDAHEMSAFF